MKSFIVRSVRYGRKQSWSALLPWAMDRLASRTAGENGAKGVTTLVLAASGGGNIGDQALLEATLQHLNPLQTIVIGESSNSKLPQSSGPWKVVPIPGLLSGIGVARFVAHRKFSRLIHGCENYVVIGADLMDGLYNPRRTLARLSTLHTASERGVNGHVVGFSWPEQPTPLALKYAIRVSKRCAMYLRDPVSFRRFSADGGRARQSADIVFTDHRRAELPESLRAWLANTTTSRVAVVNASGLIEKKQPQLEEYGRIIARLRADGHTLVFLPHVFREGDGDIAIVREIHRSFGLPTDYLVEEELTPGAVRALSDRADLVITGRMHLAVMALNASVPAITLATQGKVEGLYAMFALPSLVVDPSSGFGEEVCRVINDEIPGVLRSALLERALDVRELASRNSEGWA